MHGAHTIAGLVLVGSRRSAHALLPAALSVPVGQSSKKPILVPAARVVDDVIVDGGVFGFVADDAVVVPPLRWWGGTLCHSTAKLYRSIEKLRTWRWNQIASLLHIGVSPAKLGASTLKQIASTSNIRARSEKQQASLLIDGASKAKLGASCEKLEASTVTAGASLEKLRASTLKQMASTLNIGA